MTNNFDFIDKFGEYFWLIIIGLYAGFLNAGNNKTKSTTRKLSDLIIGMMSAPFFAWIAYEVAFYAYESVRLAFAVGAFFAWKGGVWIGEIVDKIIDSRLNLKDTECYSDYENDIK